MSLYYIYIKSINERNPYSNVINYYLRLEESSKSVEMNREKSL